MKKEEHNIGMATQQRHFKKKYLQRVVEDEDAEKEIRNYRPSQVSDTQHVDAEGSLRNLHADT